MMEAFVYCWTDIKTDKLYVGWHKGSTDDGYICSSKLMLEEYNNRSSDFKRQIVATGLAKDMVALESAILRAENVSINEHYYNMHNGNGKFYLTSHTEESKRKISNSKIGVKRPDLSKKNMTSSNPAKMGLCGRDMTGEKNPMFAKKHSDQSIEKMSRNRKGKGRMAKSEETKMKMAEARRQYWAKRRGEL